MNWWAYPSTYGFMYCICKEWMTDRKRRGTWRRRPGHAHRRCVSSRIGPGSPGCRSRRQGARQRGHRTGGSGGGRRRWQSVRRGWERNEHQRDTACRHTGPQHLAGTHNRPGSVLTAGWGVGGSWFGLGD